MLQKEKVQFRQAVLFRRQVLYNLKFDTNYDKYHHMLHKIIVFWHQLLSIIIFWLFEHSWNHLECHNSKHWLKVVDAKQWWVHAAYDIMEYVLKTKVNTRMAPIVFWILVQSE